MHRPVDEDAAVATCHRKELQGRIGGQGRRGAARISRNRTPNCSRRKQDTHGGPPIFENSKSVNTTVRSIEASKIPADKTSLDGDDTADTKVKDHRHRKDGIGPSSSYRLKSETRNARELAVRNSQVTIPVELQAIQC